MNIMNTWTDREVSRRLALAIGWNKKNVMIDDVYGTQLAQCWCYTGECWREFDYMDWNVIGPIAARYNMFPRNAGGWWNVGGYGAQSTRTAQKAIALAVICHEA